METNTQSSETHTSTYKEVVVISEDGNQMLMNKCLNCGFIVRNHAFSKIAHWRNCPFKWNFKYLSQNEGDRGFMAICLACRTRIRSKTYLEMVDHYNKRCVMKQHAHDNGGVDFYTTQYDGDNEELQYFDEKLVSRREILGQRKLYAHNSAYTLVPGYKCKYLQTSNGVERFGECQKCLKSLKKPSSSKLIIHRNICPLPTELLFSVSTQSTAYKQPFDMTISSSMVDDDGCSAPKRSCFICNTTESETFSNLYDTVSKHSMTLIFDFIWKFLDNQPSVRDDSIEAANSDWSSICKKCLQRINDYDLACVQAAKFEKELRDELSKTEALYSNRNNIDESSAVIEESQEDEHVDVEELLPIEDDDDDREQQDQSGFEITHMEIGQNEQHVETCIIDLSDEDDNASGNEVVEEEVIDGVSVTQKEEEQELIELSDDDDE